MAGVGATVTATAVSVTAATVTAPAIATATVTPAFEQQIMAGFLRIEESPENYSEFQVRFVAGYDFVRWSAEETVERDFAGIAMGDSVAIAVHVVHVEHWLIQRCLMMIQNLTIRAMRHQKCLGVSKADA